SQYYLRARYYNQSNGRFNRVDPYTGNNSDPQSLHKYTYCHNNPINGIDPSGQSFLGTTLNVLNVMSIMAVVTSVVLKSVRIGLNMRHLVILSDLMIRLAKTGIDLITQLQIRNYVFLVATAIIFDTVKTAISLVHEVLAELSFAIVATVVIAVVAGLADAGGLAVRLEKAANTSKMAMARAVGEAGEDAAGIVAKKTRIESLSGTAKYRIPDELTDLHLREVKNRAYVSKTAQIKDFLLHCKKYDLDFILDVRKNTKIAKTLLKLEDEGIIIIKKPILSRIWRELAFIFHLFGIY
ncbi:MAG: putative toxin, partial [Planctomycetota bacterium]